MSGRKSESSASWISPGWGYFVHLLKNHKVTFESIDFVVLVLFSSCMAVETIGEAWQLGWRITARCAWGKGDGMKSVRPCVYSYDLDLRTLVWSRGAPFPLCDLASRL